MLVLVVVKDEYHEDNKWTFIVLKGVSIDTTE